ncbi:PKD domain-containing protein [Flammeovirga sp. EKP202]|uniref:PKD domain-containing protein n=1 Tax=Flammeovirga sp. EKP202 TaxID=2770592 RepID=UPI00165F8387|nr:PKD domain-containing protein [Flammeovirga sp. EKP202]MBD0401595.1 PKD domain-containing protein [Flammeovirga sp. EKP202]
MRKFDLLKLLILGLIALAFGSCSDDDSTTVDVPTAVLKITQDSDDNSKVTVEVEEATGVLSYAFSFGDGNTVNAEGPKASHTYLWNSEFTVSVVLTSAQGVSEVTGTLTVTDAESEVICNNNYYQLLTGGCQDGGPGLGKTWKFSIAPGAFQVGPGPEHGDWNPDQNVIWWGSQYNHWGGNNGEGISMPEALKSRFTFGLFPNVMEVQATHQINNWQEDITAEAYIDFESVYEGEDSYSVSIIEEDGTMFLQIMDGGFLGYKQTVDGVVNSKYEIVSLTETELYVRYLNVLNKNEPENGMNYRYLKFVQEDVVEEEPAPAAE